MKFMNMCLFHFGWLFSICAVLLLLFWLSLPEVCARTYKLLGACSCVLSFKAEFFLRNKKQLIWLKCNSFTTFWITELSAFPLHTGWMLISPRKFNTKYQTNRKIKFYFNTLQIADCSDLQKKTNVYVRFDCGLWVFYRSTGIFFSIGSVHSHVHT